MPNIYLVGGTVRDMLIEEVFGIPKISDDLDYLVEDISFKELSKFVEDLGRDIIHINHNFLNIKTRNKDTEKYEDYTICRKDTYFQQHKLPNITPGSLEDDLSRRDFKMNAIVYNVKSKEYIDLFNGKKDIENKIISCVGDTLTKFLEDVVRVIRAFRFAITYNFKLDPNIYRVLLDKDSKEKIIEAFDKIPSNRITNELGRLFEKDFIRVMRLLSQFDDDLLNSILRHGNIKIKVNGK